MNQIKPARWSPDWYELTSTEELITVSRQAKSAVRSRTGKSRTIWLNRIRKLEEELHSREESEQDFEEMEP